MQRQSAGAHTTQLSVSGFFGDNDPAGNHNKSRAIDVSPSGLAGPYTLTLDIGSTCPVVPQEERIRKYTAQLDDSSATKVLTLSDATFLNGPICTGGSRRFAGIGCDQFFASEDLDTMQFFLENNNDEAMEGTLWSGSLQAGGWKSSARPRED